MNGPPALFIGIQINEPVTLSFEGFYSSPSLGAAG